MRGLAFALLFAAGCYSPSVGDCEYACSANGACPSGLVCQGNACRVEGASGSCDAAHDAGGSDEDGRVSDEPDAGPRKPFGNVTLQKNLMGYTQPSLTTDEQQLWAVYGTQIVHLDYNTSSQQFENPQVVPHVNGSAQSVTTTPSVNNNGTIIYFSSNMNGTFDVFHASRSSSSFDFSLSQNDLELDTTTADERPGTVDTPADCMILTLGNDDASDLYESKYVSSMWTMPMRLDGLSSGKGDLHPTLSGDGKTVVFASNREGNSDLYIARRPTLDAPFEMPEAIGELNTVADEGGPWLSPDGKVIYFTQGLGMSAFLYRAAVQ